MGLVRPQVALNQRTDFEDFNRLSDLGLDNIAAALGGFLGLSSQVMRGLTIEATDPASMLVTLRAGAALTTRPIIVADDQAVGPFADNSSGNPRIDLVSIAYAEADTNTENRVFINQATGTPFNQDTPTKKTSAPTVQITQGTPAPSPVAPATPAGHIALAQVRVESGATSIAANKITNVTTGRNAALVYRTDSGESDFDLPYDSIPLVTVATPPGHVTLFVGRVSVRPGTLSRDYAYSLQVIDEDDLGVTVASYHELFTPELNSVPSQTMLVWGCRLGPADAKACRLRFTRYPGGSGGTTETAIHSLQLAAITLPGFEAA